MFGYIYKTTNMINNKMYVGQHKGEFNSAYHGSGLLINRAIKKHGAKAFKTEVICYLPTRAQLDEFEMHLIAKYREILGRDNLYNVTDGGPGGCLDRPLKVREKIRSTMKKIDSGKWLRGRKLSEAHKRNIGLGGKGKKCPKSEEVRKKISDTLKGGKLSEETKIKMREFQLNNPNTGRFIKGNKMSDEMKDKMREGWILRKQKI